MQHVPTIEIARRALRATVCPACSQRPPHSETLPTSMAMVCEAQCPIFLHIPELMSIAEAEAGKAGPIGQYERAMQEQICNGCCTRPTAGDYCRDRLTCACPLSRFAGAAVSVLEAVAKSRQHASGTDAPAPPATNPSVPKP